jgi:hypothetical protein
VKKRGMKKATKRKLRLIAGVSAFMVALWLLWTTPVVFPLKIFVVLLHEISHGMAAVLTGGTVDRILLDTQQGGATYTRGGSPFLILSAGYLGSLLWGLLLIELAGSKATRARWALTTLATVLIVVAVLYVRSLFGFLFTITFGAALLFAARRLPPVGVARALMALGVTSALYALLDIRSDVLQRPHLPSDAYMLGEMTGVPALVWGVAWIITAVLVSGLALRRWLRRA